MHSLRFGDSVLTVNLPDDRVDMIVGVPADTPCDSASAGEPAFDARDLIRDALDRANPGLDAFLGDSTSVLIVVSDHTRNTGSRVYMPLLLARIRKPGRKITVLVALGLHRPSTDEEILGILGCEPTDDVTLRNHDPDCDLTICGEGTFCRYAVEADRIILTGSVAFHPMAGYAGGRKSLLPGIASRENIISNHRLYFSGGVMNPGVGPARLVDNPIHADIRRRTAGFNPRLWCLNVVQDEMKSIVFAAAGLVDEAWQSCVEYHERHNLPRIDRLYPVVVASAGGFPSDFSFYQSMKTLANSSRACVPGGSIYLLLECRNGWELESRILEWGSLELHEVAKRVGTDFTMSGLAMYMALSVIRKYRVHCLSSLPAREVAGLGMRPVASIRELEDLVRAETADRIALIPAAASILPAMVGAAQQSLPRRGSPEKISLEGDTDVP